MPLTLSTMSVATRGRSFGKLLLPPLLPPLLPFLLGPPVQEEVGDPLHLLVRATLDRHSPQRVELLLFLPLQLRLLLRLLLHLLMEPHGLLLSRWGP